MLRETLDGWVDKVFPGMGIRPVYLTIIASTVMILYWYWSRSSLMPDWFLDTAVQLTGVTDKAFHGRLWGHFLCLVLMGIVPTVITLVTDRMGLGEMGLGVRKAGREFLIVTVLFVLFVPFVLYFSTWPGFQRTYPRIAAAKVDANIFLLFHLLYLVKWAAWEYFFRGWMLFAFKRDFGTRSVLISTIPFALMHYGKPEVETLSAIAAGFILCWLALKGRSIWPGVAIHAAVSRTMELFATKWFWEWLGMGG